MELLWKLNHDQGITVLMVTHEADMAQYARRIVRFVGWRGGQRPAQPASRGPARCGAGGT